MAYYAVIMAYNALIPVTIKHAMPLIKANLVLYTN